MMLSFDMLAPIDPMACRVCVAEVTGINAYSIHSWTLCPYHWSEWADDKMASEEIWA